MTNKRRTIRILVACIDASGVPDLYCCRVTCSEGDYTDGKHYTAAKNLADEDGYGSPMVAFDEFDACGKLIVDKFIWGISKTIGI
jgi:hypothetical protein